MNPRAPVLTVKDDWANEGCSDLGLLDIFSKRNQVTLSLQGERPTVFVTNDKNLFLNKNENFGELASATVSFTASEYLDFSDETGGDVNRCYFCNTM